MQRIANRWYDLNVQVSPRPFPTGLRLCWSPGSQAANYPAVLALAAQLGCNAIIAPSWGWKAAVPAGWYYIVKCQTNAKYPLSWYRDGLKSVADDPFFLGITLDQEQPTAAINLKLQRGIRRLMLEICPDAWTFGGPVDWNFAASVQQLGFMYSGLLGALNVSGVNRCGLDIAWYDALHRYAACGWPVLVSPQLTAGDTTAGDAIQVGIATNYLLDENPNGIALWGVDKLAAIVSEAKDALLGALCWHHTPQPGVAKAVDSALLSDNRIARAACRILALAGYRPEFADEGARVMRLEDMVPADKWAAYIDAVAKFADGGKVTRSVVLGMEGEWAKGV